jgi:hypothetical protein
MKQHGIAKLQVSKGSGISLGNMVEGLGIRVQLVEEL